MVGEKSLELIFTIVSYLFFMATFPAPGYAVLDRSPVT